MCLNIGLEKLIKRLNSSNPTIRERTIQDLVSIGGLAIERLTEALNDSSENIRHNAKIALKKIKNIV